MNTCGGWESGRGGYSTPRRLLTQKGTDLLNGNSEPRALYKSVLEGGITVIGALEGESQRRESAGGEDDAG